ncbi:hypothetical protein [Nonomuraea soli]|uniref:Uncharacterized protein n=1 Tax=Nonomuraea soli TaxID=1032476 RepID=A0A7W0HQ02_9ACTN|nr:hypothetical protein [Nonomuraea soli]MBA2891131.1 hypothetical protein [Nonomuraea soli]
MIGGLATLRRATVLAVVRDGLPIHLSPLRADPGSPPGSATPTPPADPPLDRLSSPAVESALRHALARAPGLKALCLAVDLPPGHGAPVAAVRIAGPCPPALAPRLDIGHTTAPGSTATIIRGGHDLTGRPLAPLDLPALRRFARTCGLRDFAVTATGSPVLADHELQAAAAIADEVPGARITLSYEYGRAGLREREQWAIANAALCPGASHLADHLVRLLPGLPLYVARTGEGLVSAHYFRRYPLTCAEGATTSLHRAQTALAHRAAPASPRDASRTALTSPGDASRTALAGAHLAAYGATLAVPMAGVERIVRARGTAELDRAVSDAQDEALTRVLSAGAVPGSARVSSVAVNPLSYLPDGLFRLRVRAEGATP